MAFRLPGGGVVSSETARRPALGAARRAAWAVALLPAVLGVAGCFDAPTVDPGPYVIDDFEDGTRPTTGSRLWWMVLRRRQPDHEQEHQLHPR